MGRSTMPGSAVLLQAMPTGAAAATRFPAGSFRPRLAHPFVDMKLEKPVQSVEGRLKPIERLGGYRCREVSELFCEVPGGSVVIELTPALERMVEKVLLELRYHSGCLGFQLGWGYRLRDI